MNQLSWTIFAFVVSAVASAGAAWGGAKYALKSFEARIGKLETRSEKMVTIDTCRGERGDCRGDRESIMCELNRKIDRIFTALEDSERKREAGKDVYMAKFETLAVQIEGLKNHNK